jgi:hypothetical protein
VRGEVAAQWGEKIRQTMATIPNHSFWRQLGQLATTLPKVPGGQPRPAKEGQKNNRGGWCTGGRSTVKTMKTASRTWKEGGRRMERDCQTIPTISDNGFEDNLDNWEQLFQGAGRTTPPGAKRTKGAAGERVDGQH